MSRRISSVIVLVIVVLGTLIVVPKVQKAGADEVNIGVKTGDWIKYDYAFDPIPTFGGEPIPVVQWRKIEFLNVERPAATVRLTTHMSSGMEDNGTFTWNATKRDFGSISSMRFIIQANCQTGNVVVMRYGNATIAGEVTRAYLGVSRTVVYASHSEQGSQLTYYWDKETGVMVEVNSVGTGMEGGEQKATIKVTGTSLWQALFLGLPIPILLYIIVAAFIVIALGTTVFLIRRKKKPPEVAPPTQPTQP